MTLQLTSPAFADGDAIPPRYTTDGQNINPPLEIGGLPEGTVALALIMDDPDAATDPHGPGKVFDHWVLMNIPPGVSKIEEGSVPDSATEGRNSTGQTGYTGPNPPTGTHRYVFRLFALSEALDLNGGADKRDVLEEASSVTLGTAELTGTYRKGSEVTGG